MEWFIKASAPFKGMELSTVSEILSVHDYESKTLTKAFAEITGIQVNHEMMDEGLIVDKISTEIQSGKPIYDFWMNDSDFIGTHPRHNDIVGGSLTDFMAGDGKEITNPNLDLNDFIGLSFGTFTDGSSISCPTSSSPTFIGSDTTGSSVPNSRPRSRTNSVTSSAFPSTGRPMKTSPTSSPTR